MVLQLDDDIARCYQAVEAFVAAVLSDSANDETWLLTLESCLANLYAAALHVRDRGVETHDVLPAELHDEAARATERVRAKAQSLLGERRHYRALFHTELVGEPESDPVVGDLVDDLGDITHDVYPAYVALRDGLPLATVIAAHAWRPSAIQWHWPRHALAALGALRVMR
jgi:hypothetical protein